jgi:hypothetical protein
VSKSQSHHPHRAGAGVWQKRRARRFGHNHHSSGSSCGRRVELAPVLSVGIFWAWEGFFPRRFQPGTASYQHEGPHGPRPRVPPATTTIKEWRWAGAVTPILVRISSMTTCAATWAPRTPSFPTLRKHDDNHGGSDVEWGNLPSSPAPCTASKTTMETAFGGTPSTPSSRTFDDDDDGDSDGATLSSCAASTTTGAVT